MIVAEFVALVVCALYVELELVSTEGAEDTIGASSSPLSK
jgi:hypothetical protein